MKFAKSCKIFLFIISLLVVSLSSLQLLSVKDKAFAEAKPSDAFGATNATLSYAENCLKADLEEGAKIKIRNKLAINNFEIEASVGESVSEITVTLEYDSVYENGISKDGVDYDDTIESVLKITVNQGGYSVDFNGITNDDLISKDGYLTFGFSTLNNVITAKVENKSIANIEDYYKIAGKDKNVATITLDFKLVENATDNKTFNIFHIDQDTKDTEHKYKQIFKLDADKNISTYAYPVVSLSDDVFTDKGIQVIDANKYSFTLNAYSVFNKVQSSDLFLTAEGAEKGTIVLENSDKPKYARFIKPSDDSEVTMKFGVASKDPGSPDVKIYGTYSVIVVDNDIPSNKAPEYFSIEDNVKDTNEYKAFESKLNKLIDEVRLGDKITIPSMKDLVKDDNTTYSKLTHTVYYKTPSNDVGSTTGWTLDINEAGDYLFYVVFKDEQGKEMSKDDFFTVSDTDENEIVDKKYKAFVFRFKVQDDEPFSVTEAETENKGKGFVGVKYKTKPFEVKGYDYTQNYLLYYNPNVDATEEDDGWILVQEGDNYTAEQIASIDYDDQRTFTPDKKGAYMIECTAISNNEAKSATARTIIKVDGDATAVKPLNTWFRDHLAPMIFLMIGSVCLIILVVLIFIKPKQPITVKEETKAPKKK